MEPFSMGINNYFKNEAIKANVPIECSNFQASVQDMLISKI